MIPGHADKSTTIDTVPFSHKAQLELQGLLEKGHVAIIDASEIY